MAAPERLWIGDPHGEPLSEDGVREKLHGDLERYRKLFIGENLYLSTPERIDVWRQVSAVDQGSGLQ